MASRNQPYLPLYVQDFMSDEKVRNCSAESIGVYIYTMCFLHKANDYGSITLEERQKKYDDNIKNFACVLLRQLPFELDEIERGLSQLVEEGVMTIDGDTLFQKRMVRDAEIGKKRAIAGSLGGLASRNRSESSTANNKQTSSKNQANKTANIKQNTEIESDIESENDIKAINITRNNVDSSNLPSALDKKLEKSFGEFWNAYPKKVGKQDAKKVFDKVKVPIETLLSAIERQKRGSQWSKDNGQYIPNPATWLRQGRWEDEVYIAPQSTSRPTAKRSEDYRGESFFDK